MEVPYARLRGRIAQCGFNWSSLAKEVGVSHTTMHNKLNCVYPFNTWEVEEISKVLGIKKTQWNMYFFSEYKKGEK